MTSIVIIAKDEVEGLLKASGVNPDVEQLDVMMSKLKGKSITELIREGTQELATMGGGGAASAGGAATAQSNDAPAQKEEEAPKEEEEEVEDIGGLFDDDEY